MPRALLVLFALLVPLAALAGCSSTPPPTASDVANRVAAAVPGSTPGAVLTAETDPNRLLGRPGGYSSSAVINDPRTPPESRTEPTALDQGAKVEVFDDEGQAETREQYLNALSQSGSPLTAAGYTYRSGTVVLRVSPDLTPSAAEQYRAALEPALSE